MSAGKTFDAAEFRRTLERVGAGSDFGSTNPQPALDHYIRREVAAEAIAGRKIGDYKMALEACGFRYIPAQGLRRYPDGRKHDQGEWRNEAERAAFTDEDVLSLFPGGAWEFYAWFQKRRLQARAGQSRILVP